jgi:hypothetical protein
MDGILIHRFQLRLLAAQQHVDFFFRVQPIVQRPIGCKPALLGLVVGRHGNHAPTFFRRDLNRRRWLSSFTSRRGARGGLLRTRRLGFGCALLGSTSLFRYIHSVFLITLKKLSMIAYGENMPEPVTLSLITGIGAAADRTWVPSI